MMNAVRSSYFEARTRADFERFSEMSETRQTAQNRVSPAGEIISQHEFRELVRNLGVCE